MHLCWPFWLFEIAYLFTSTSVVVHHLDVNYAILTNILQLAYELCGVGVQQIDGDQPRN